MMSLHACSGGSGAAILSALQSAKPLHVALAAATLRHVLHNNASCKQRLLSVAPEQGAVQGPPLFFLCLENFLSRALGAKLQGEDWFRSYALAQKGSTMLRLTLRFRIGGYR